MSDAGPAIMRYDMAEDVTAFSTMRHGGVSTGRYASFNINAYCGDSPLAVANNTAALAAALGIDAERIVMPRQTHGTEVRIVTRELAGLPRRERDITLDGVDALMTDVGGLCIGVSTADCTPILLYDEPHNAVAAIHAGWRGTVERIAQKTVRAMEAAYGTDGAMLRAVIGPCISRKNFEVGQEVYDKFLHASFDMASIAVQMHNGCELKWHIDLPLCNLMQLEECGLRRDNVIVSDLCTFDNCDRLFSARRLGTMSGRIYTGIMTKG